MEIREVMDSTKTHENKFYRNLIPSTKQNGNWQIFMFLSKQKFLSNLLMIQCFWCWNLILSTVKLVFNSHLWDKGKTTGQDKWPLI